MPPLFPPSYAKDPRQREWISRIRDSRAPKVRSVVPEIWVRSRGKIRVYADGNFLRSNLLLDLNRAAVGRFRLALFYVSSSVTLIDFVPDGKIVRSFLGLLDFSAPIINEGLRWLFKIYLDRKIRQVYGKFYPITRWGILLVGRSNNQGSMERSRFRIRLRLENKHRFVVPESEEKKKIRETDLVFDDVLEVVQRGVRDYLKGWPIHCDSVGTESGYFGRPKVVAYRVRGPKLGIAADSLAEHLLLRFPILRNFQLSSMLREDVGAGVFYIDVWETVISPFGDVESSDVLPSNR